MIQEEGIGIWPVSYMLGLACTPGKGAKGGRRMGRGVRGRGAGTRIWNQQPARDLHDQGSSWYVPPRRGRGPKAREDHPILPHKPFTSPQIGRIIKMIWLA